MSSFKNFSGMTAYVRQKYARTFSFGCLDKLYCVSPCWVRRCRTATGDCMKHWPQR